MLYIYETPVRMHHTDAAGLIFYGSIFSITQDAFESFCSDIGFDFGKWFQSMKFITPVVHAESDYIKPILLGDRLKIKAMNEKIGKTSFTMFYHFYNQKNILVAKTRIVHVVVNHKTRKKQNIPKNLLQALLQFAAKEKDSAFSKK